MIKVYISGKITGLPLLDAQCKFEWAERQIERLKMTPVNPMKKETPMDASWNEHMVEDIRLLLNCQAIYLQTDWQDSLGARIEEYIARETGKIIIEQQAFSAWKNSKEE